MSEMCICYVSSIQYYFINECLLQPFEFRIIGANFYYFVASRWINVELLICASLYSIERIQCVRYDGGEKNVRLLLCQRNVPFQNLLFTIHLKLRLITCKTVIWWMVERVQYAIIPNTYDLLNALSRTQSYAAQFNFW